MLLLKLHKYLCVPILTEWLDLKDIGRLEVASKGYVSWLHALFQSYGHKFDAILKDKIPLSCSSLKWLSKNNFPIEACTFEIHLSTLKEFKSFHPTMWTKVKYLLKGKKSTLVRKKADLGAYYKCFPSIKSIRVDGASLGGRLKTLNRLLDRITSCNEIIVTSNQSCTEATMAAISCRRLFIQSLHNSDIRHCLVRSPLLEHLEINFCTEYQYNFAATLIVHCRKLSTFRLHNSRHVDAPVIRRMAYMFAFHGSKCLTTVSALDLSELQMRCLVAYRRELKLFTSWIGMMDTVVPSTYTGIVSEFDVDWFAHQNLSIEDITHSLDAIPEVKKVRLFFENWIADGMTPLLENHVESLVHLKIRNLCVGTYFPSLVNLQVLDASHSRSLTDNGLICIGNRCPNLVYLCIKSTFVSDTGLEGIIIRGKLKLLIASTTNVGAPSIRLLAKHCRSLHTLEIYNLITNVRVDTLKLLVMCCLHLRFLYCTFDLVHPLQSFAAVCNPQLILSTHGVEFPLLTDF